MIPRSHLKRAKPTRAGQGGDITVDESGHLRIPVMSEVNVRLEVDPQVEFEDLRKGRAMVSFIDIYCDDKEAFLKSVKRSEEAS